MRGAGRVAGEGALSQLRALRARPEPLGTRRRREPLGLGAGRNRWD